MGSLVYFLIGFVVIALTGVVFNDKPNPTIISVTITGVKVILVIGAVVFIGLKIGEVIAHG